GCTFQYGLAYLIPALRARGLSLEEAGVLVACPTAGLLLTLVAWGAAADRFGERLVLASGLAAAGVLLLAASRADRTVALGGCLVAAGAAGGSVYAASGRLILGWFAASQRGLAMGIRQSAQPLGVAVAAVSLPSLAAHGLSAGLVFLGVFCLAAVLLVIVVVRDPAHQARAGGGPGGSPYRAPALWRPHAAGAPVGGPPVTGAPLAPGLLVALPPRAAPPAAGGRGRHARPPARGRGWRRGTGRTGWAAGCGRCGRWPWPSRPSWWPWPPPPGPPRRSRCPRCSPRPCSRSALTGSRSPRWPSMPGRSGRAAPWASRTPGRTWWRRRRRRSSPR